MAGISVSIVVLELGTICPIRKTFCTCHSIVCVVVYPLALRRGTHGARLGALPENSSVHTLFLQQPFILENPHSFSAL
jgi:hypothetical protein